MEIAWLEGDAFNRDTVSIAVTTYGTQSYYTHRCLEAIRQWKERRHELVVACHDASPLLEYYLKACAKDGLIDRLLFTPSNFGHTMGVNRCFAEARGKLLFSLANDRHRLVIAEYEEYLIDDNRPYDRTPTRKARRLVFVDHVELG